MWPGPGNPDKRSRQGWVGGGQQGHLTLLFINGVLEAEKWWENTMGT